MITATRITSLHGIDPHDAPIVENKPFLTALTISDVADGIIKTYQQIYAQQFQWDLIYRDDYRILHVVGLKPHSIPLDSLNETSSYRVSITDYFLITGEEENIYANADAEEIAEKEERKWLEEEARSARKLEKDLKDEEARSWAEWWVDKHTPFIGELMIKGSFHDLLAEVIMNVYKRLKDVDQD